MNKSEIAERAEFKKLFLNIPDITKKRHTSTLISHAKANLAYLKQDIYDLKKPSGKKASSCIVISAGPSLHRKNSIKRILRANYPGSIVAADGAYLACLRAGLIPDYVVTLDSHATRITRWFGDHDFERHSDQDDYFERQDLN
ncbi:MAG: 6-hydroxymethylpterin diphosphokinase MptE-like protein, partial [Deltaproteobacteria bacterium]